MLHNFFELVPQNAKKPQNFMAPFYGWGFKASATSIGSLLFTTNFPAIPGTHFIDLRRMKGWVDLEVTQWFWTLEIQHLNH